MNKPTIEELEAQVKQLAAENAALKSAFTPEEIPEDAVEAFNETAIMDHDWNDTGEWSWVENDTDVIRAVLEAIKPETPATDAYAASLRAEGVVDDYFGALVAKARASAEKAMRKFPQPNYVLLKVAEEAGEVVQAGVHYAENRMTWEQVEGEIIQLLAMLIRLVTEGDQINGITPPDAAQLRSKSEVQS